MKYTIEEVKAQKEADKYRFPFANYLRYRSLRFCDSCQMYYESDGYRVFYPLTLTPTDERVYSSNTCPDCVEANVWLGLFEKKWSIHSLHKVTDTDLCIFVMPEALMRQELAKLSHEDKSNLWIARVKLRGIYMDTALDAEPIEPLMRVVPFDGDDDPFAAPVWGGGEES